MEVQIYCRIWVKSLCVLSSALTETVKVTYFFILFTIDYDIKGTGSFVLLRNGQPYIWLWFLL